MSVLFDLSGNMSRADGMGSILTAIVDAAAQLLLCRRVSLLMPDEHGKHLRIARALGLPGDVLDRVAVPFGGGIAGRVFATRREVVANDGAPQPVLPDESPCFANGPFASMPIASSSCVFGVLNVAERHRCEPFGEIELEFLSLLAATSASGIERFRSRKAVEDAQFSIVTSLATLAEYRDANIGRHLERVTRYAVTLARELQRRGPYAGLIDETFEEDLRRAMPLHDIGKVAVSDAILLKAGALTQTERAAVQGHTEVGARVISSVIDSNPEAAFLVMAREIAHYHHERFDGSGYPAGLRGQKIPLAARIAAVADIYDALKTKRPYKKALSHDVAARAIHNGAGTLFDPAVVDAFRACAEKFADLAGEFGDPADRCRPVCETELAAVVTPP